MQPPPPSAPSSSSSSSPRGAPLRAQPRERRKQRVAVGMRVHHGAQHRHPQRRPRACEEVAGERERRRECRGDGAQRCRPAGEEHGEARGGEEAQGFQCALLWKNRDIHTQKSGIRNGGKSNKPRRKDRKRNGEGLGLGLGIAPPSGKPAGGSRRHTALIHALYAREQAVPPPSPEHGRAARALGTDRDKAPGSRQPRAGAALLDPLLGARP
ncbi:hypothetical protein T484DRAFT_1751247 [Baffinella frigidus]|nr:hypothetical protein T484DRAFT_1751247 [Cryptophyta sp. CCMP2293]